MSTDFFFSGAFLGQRFLDESIDRSQQTFDSEVSWTLSFTPTKDYPSIFGAGLHEPSPTILHGVYRGTTRKGSMKEFIDGISTFEYQCELTVDQRKNKVYLHGTWKSLIDEHQFGKLVTVCHEMVPRTVLSGIWVGQSDPDEQLADFLLPINPIRWCMTVFPTDETNWRLCGCGYFNDAADIPDEPLIFFSLDGQGTLEEMKVTKKYLKADYVVEYTGKFIRNDDGNYRFVGKWSNALAGSYGSFFANQFQLNQTTLYQLDICICEICTRIIYPGENRWCCFPCHFSTCVGCHLHKTSRAHPHPLQVNILPSQKAVRGKSCYEFIENAFQSFEKSSLLIYRNRNDEQELIRMSYGEIAKKCRALAKYWKQLVGQVDEQHRPVILFMADSSPAYLCGLLAGLLCQAIVYPINGSLHEDALVHTLSTSQPSILVVGEKYFQKFNEIFLSDNKRSFTIIYPEEEQFGSKIVNDAKTKSFTEALREGESNTIDLRPSFELSSDAIAAIFCTSGSTGFPKGAVFTEDLLLPNDTFAKISPFIRIDYQSFDPVLLLSLMSTIKYGSCRGMTNLKDMWIDIKEMKPTSLGLTPSIWNNLYKEYLSKIRGMISNVDRENVARQMREDLGGRLIVGTTGGGSISPTVLAFIRNQLKIDIADMYGCRECGNIARNGVIYPGVDVKLIPVPDLDLDGIDEGEICVHSPKMINEYYRIDRSSAFIEIDGKRYYRTGDVGKLHGRIIQLTDRSGTMIKNSMAEWISPVKIENIIEQLSEVSFCFVVGDANYAHLGVIVCPSISGSTLDSLEMLQLIRFHCVHCGLSGPEIPQCIYLEKDIVWNESNGLYKEKKCRSALTKHYSEIKTTIFTQHIIDHQNKDQALNQSFLDVLERILNRSLTGLINGDNTFIEIGGDSQSLNLLCKAFHDQDIPMQPSIIYNHSLKHLERIFTKKLNIDDQMIEHIDWNKEFILPSHLKTLITSTSTDNGRKNKHILLTGATGFLGPLLLYEILQSTEKDVLVYCLIRADTIEHAQARLKDDLIKCQREHLIDWNRIRCLVGSVTKINLGLTIEFYNQLLEEIGYVYHNASWVNIAMPYKSLKQANVQGTLNCLELACRCHAKLIYISSIAALPSSNQSAEDPNGWVTLTLDDINRKDGYGQTKVVAEQLLKRASLLGADVVILRPPTISADTVSGYSNLNDFINILLRYQIEMNACVNNANISFNFIPVDACAKAIVQLATPSEASGKCFNLFGKPCSISLIYQAIIKRLPHLFKTKVEQSNWKSFVMKNLSETSHYYPVRDRIASMVFVKTDAHLTRSHLDSFRDSDLFEITEEHIIRAIDFMIHSGFIVGNV